VAEVKKYQVLWTDTAQQDLTEIVEYICGRAVPELLHTGISQYREHISAPWRADMQLAVLASQYFQSR
jgi:hypothetical protein